jgi:hypothetical protein
MDRIHALDGMTKGIQGIETTHAQHGHGKDSPFPQCMEEWFVLFPYDRTKTGHASHIMDTIHV